MKKFIIFAAVAASAFCMNAQLSVLKSGNIRIGNTFPQAKGDKVEAGGTLNVKAHQIILESGVTIDAGATANFSTY